MRVSAVVPGSRSRRSWAWTAIAVTLVAVGAAWFLFPLREWLEACERWIAGLGI
jgi:hypothetical protein